MRCYYETLGVGRGADSDEIRKAYKKVALRMHPDKAAQRNEDVEKATAAFREVQAAYECLSDPQERAFYDANRASILRGDDTNAAAGRAAKKKGGATKKGKKRERREEEEEYANDAYEVNVWPFFQRDAFAEFDDDPGFEPDPETLRRKTWRLCRYAAFAAAAFAKAALTDATAFLERLQTRCSSGKVRGTLSWLVDDVLRKKMLSFVANVTASLGPRLEKEFEARSKPRRAPGFFALYGAVFQNVDAHERAAAQANGSPLPEQRAPAFGSSSSTDFARFYAHFTQFTSVRTFREAEPPELREARYLARTAREQKFLDAELAHYRRAARRKYEDSVRQLAEHCRRRDPRVAAKKQADRRAQDRARADKIKEDQRKREDFERAKREWRTGGLWKENGGGDDENDDAAVYECTVCARIFSSEHGLENHLGSKTHAKRAAEAHAKGTDEQPIESTTTTEPPDDDKPGGDGTGRFECLICDRSFLSAPALDSHLQSRAHRKNLRAAQDKVRKM